MVKISHVGNWLTAVFLSAGLFCLGCGKATLTEQIQESFENANRPSYGVSAGVAPSPMTVPPIAIRPMQTLEGLGGCPVNLVCPSQESHNGR